MTESKKKSTQPPRPLKTERKVRGEAKRNKTITLNIPQTRVDCKIDLKKALQMRVNGCSYQDIANAFGISKTAAFQLISKFDNEIQQLNVWQDNKGDILDLASVKILTAIAGKDLEEEKLSSLSGCFEVMRKNARLEQGLATSHSQIALVDLSRFERKVPQDVVVDIEEDRET